jgi:hypothetical protein
MGPRRVRRRGRSLPHFATVSLALTNSQLEARPGNDERFACAFRHPARVMTQLDLVRA